MELDSNPGLLILQVKFFLLYYYYALLFLFEMLMIIYRHQGQMTAHNSSQKTQKLLLL